MHISVYFGRVSTRDCVYAYMHKHGIYPCVCAYDVCGVYAYATVCATAATAWLWLVLAALLGRPSVPQTHNLRLQSSSLSSLPSPSSSSPSSSS